MSFRIVNVLLFDNIGELVQWKHCCP
jgi:hypothetical protein